MAEEGETDIQKFIDNGCYIESCNSTALYPLCQHAEMRGIKALRFSRDDYGDNAVGYVQVKREGNICTVKAKVTPEHKVCSKPYNVTFVCNEAEEMVNLCICEDCPASHGGCKHAVGFLSWLNRRSEEPAKTEVLCYWRRSKMAEIGTTVKFILCEDMGSSQSSFKKSEENDFEIYFQKYKKMWSATVPRVPNIWCIT